MTMVYVSFFFKRNFERKEKISKERGKKKKTTFQAQQSISVDKI